MRILFCTSTLQHAKTGSAGVARMIAGMSNARITVDVVSEDAIEENFALWQQKIPPIAYSVRSKKLCRAIDKLIKATSYDLLLFNDIWLAFGARHFLGDKRRREAVVAFMHDDNTLDRGDIRLLSGRWWSFRSRAFFERRVIRYLDALLTNSEYMVNLLAHVYPDVPRYKLYYTARDYQQVQFKPKPIDLSRRIKVLFVKHDFERGGLTELIEALRSLHQHQFQLTIVGPSRLALQRKLKHGITNSDQLNFVVQGEVTDHEVIQDLYHSHDLVCVPSWNEALGLVNAEALVSGTPVVSTRAGGIPEVLDEGRGGILTDKSNPADIAAGIEHCLSHPEATYQRTTHGRAFVLQRFDLQKMYTELQSILTEVVAKRKLKQV